MKRTFTFLQLLFFTILNFIILQNAHSQTLEIHQINVGHGDATLVILRDTHQLKENFRTYHIPIPPDPMDLLPEALANSVDLDETVVKAVLIDFGVGSKQAEKISTYLGEMSVDKLDIAILSHNHEDHYGGFKDLIEKQSVTADAAYYRGNTPLKGSTGFNKGFVNVLTKAGIPKNEVDVTATDILIDTKFGQQIKLTCIASNGYPFKKVAGSTQFVSASQNDYGIAWVLQYGAFRYFTGGDLSGFNTSSYTNLETPIVDSLVKFDNSVFTNWAGNANLDKGHVCSLKLNHHGSKNSSNAWFLYKLSPKTAMISCADKHGHPNLEVIQDLIGPQNVSDWTGVKPTDDKMSSVDSFFVTTLLKNFGDIRDNIGVSNKGIIGGDITLIVNDNNIATQSAYNVYWNGLKDVSILGSGTKPTDIRTPNPAGTRKFKCHKATTLNYITNH